MADTQDNKRAGDESGPSALEAVVTAWAVGLMGYYYYAKGYPDLLGQIWRSFFG